MAADQNQIEDGHDWSWFWRGCKNILSVPAIILLSVFIGYGGLARDAGLSFAQATFSVPTIWALPSNLILAAGVASGASLVTIFIAIALASLRLMPMTIALIPEIRAPGTKRWQLFIVSSVVAVTAWVHTMQVAPSIPQRGRLPYFAGFAFILLFGSTCMTALTFLVATKLPPIMVVVLYFLTPLYFIISIWRSSREMAEYAALILGLILCPVIAYFVPDISVLAAGLVGGVLAFGLRHLVKKRGISA